jgi:hypothetical protein
MKALATTCRICAADCRHQFSATILRKYPCAYFYCDQCGLLQTEEPYWLEEAYKSAIADADTGLVYRNLRLSGLVSTLLFFLYDREAKYLDVAGGYGMFTRLMRDIGFDFYWSDIYCQNLLARGFESTTTAPPFAAITAFEVLEHVTNPVEFIANALKQAETRTIVFSTEVFDNDPPQQDWWYYAFQTGQHVSFYQRRTLRMIGKILGLNCYSSGSLHLLTDKNIHPAVYRLLTHPWAGRFLARFKDRSMKSKMMSDHFKIMADGLRDRLPSPTSR